VVLYSKEALNITAIRRRFEQQRGTFSERVAGAVGSDYIPYYNAVYETGEIRFQARSPNPRAVFGLLLAIEHK
jgi:hypothetical protein